tara:strand:+ start:285 stop:650 length:366 start_codon:yes stop_codon:yes gene_type:complete
MSFYKDVSFLFGLLIFIFVPVITRFIFDVLLLEAQIGERSVYLVFVFLINFFSVFLFSSKVRKQSIRYVFLVLYLSLCVLFYVVLGFVSPFDYLGSYLYYGFFQGSWSLEVFQQIYITFFY